MTIDEAREADIRRLHFAEHWKVGTIAAQLGEHHETVERVLGLGKGARSSPVLPDAVAAVKVPAPLLLAIVPPLLATALATLAPPAMSSVAPEAIVTPAVPAAAVAPLTRSVPALTVVPPL